ncbi:flagellar biosynthesis protein FlhA [Vibrio breoganii]
MFKSMNNVRGAAATPIVILIMLAMIMLPLPSYLLDVFFTTNIVLAVLILVICINTKRILDFSIFPTILLIATISRLALNVASTRIILLEGHTGDEAVAGKVIMAFANVLVGGSYVVGLTLFGILMVINFLVISKGGERISEVTARFNLDGMPHKLMSVETELSNGLITQEQAIQRRKETNQESEFFGSMDGAAKFVRNDALAGFIILFVNLIAGILIGIFDHGMVAGNAFQTYALLTIGDGLVAQIPSLLLSVAAAIMVTRVSDDNNDISNTLHRQLLSSPKALYSASGVMFILGSVPGMPHLAFFAFSAVVAWAAYSRQKQLNTLENQTITTSETIPDEFKEQTETIDWNAIERVDPISLELGFALAPLVTDSKKRVLAKSIFGTRKTISTKTGFLLPQIRIKNRFNFKRNEYAILIDGNVVERGEVVLDRLLAIGSPPQGHTLDGIIGEDPAFKQPALWIRAEDKAKAINLGFSVVGTHDVIATHVSKICFEHLDGIFNYDDIKNLNTKLANEHPELADTLGKAVTPNHQMQVVRHLLAEQVPITNYRTIANTLIEFSERIKSPLLLAEKTRIALGRTIMNLISPNERIVPVFVLSKELEDKIKAKITLTQQTETEVSINEVAMDPDIHSQLELKLPRVYSTMEMDGKRAVIAVKGLIRPIIATYAKRYAPGLIVISLAEVPHDFTLAPFAEMTDQ